MDDVATGWPPKNAFEAAGDGEPSLDAGLPSLDADLPSPGSDDDDAAPPPAWMVPAAAAPASSDPLRDEEYWARPEIQVKIERMRELGEKAKLHATSRREKRLLAQYYTEEGLRRRVLLLSHPKVVRALETIWKATDTDRSGAIDREEYLVMHRKLVLALDPTTPPKTAFEAAAEDWVKDADGKRFMDKERFYWCWFELADLWTDSLDPKVRRLHAEDLPCMQVLTAARRTCLACKCSPQRSRLARSEGVR
jgi:hypothetical protein